MAERNYNVMSEHGVTDQEYADDFGLPQELVGTPDMNDWMIDKIYEDNVRDCSDALVSQRHDRGRALNICKKTAERNKTEAYALLRSVQKRRGY